MMFPVFRFHRVVVILVVLLAGLAPGLSSARAATCTASVDTLSFDDVDTLAGDSATSSADITISCSDVSASSVSACVNLGAGSGGTDSGSRLMIRAADTSDTLDYGLYQDNSHSTSFGSSSASDLGDPESVSLSASDGTAEATVTVYGRVPGAQTSAAEGTYSDSVPVTVSYLDGSTLDCSSQSAASQATSTMVVSATIEPNCLISTTDLNFGTVGLMEEDATAEASATITCTPDADYSISMGDGLHADGDQRRMESSAGDYVTYDLYQDSSHSQAWGNTTGSDTVDGTASGTDTFEVYGVVPVQSVPAGTYSDVITVTVTY